MSRRRLVITSFHIAVTAVALLAASITLSSASDTITLASASTKALAANGVYLTRFTGSDMHVSRRQAVTSTIEQRPRYCYIPEYNRFPCQARNLKLHAVEAVLADVTFYPGCGQPSLVPAPYWVVSMSRHPKTSSPREIHSHQIFIDLVDPRTGRFMYEDISTAPPCEY